MHGTSVPVEEPSTASKADRGGGGGVLSLGNSRGRPCSSGAPPLPGEIVADVGIAIRGIKPQAPIKRKRLIQLIDLRAGVSDGRRNVRAGRWLGQRQRWCA